MAVSSIESKNALPICDSNGSADIMLMHFGIFELAPDRVEGHFPGLRLVTRLGMIYMMLLTVLIHTVNGSRPESGCVKSYEHSQQMALTHF